MDSLLIKKHSIVFDKVIKYNQLMENQHIIREAIQEYAKENDIDLRNLAFAIGVVPKTLRLFIHEDKDLQYRTVKKIKTFLDSVN